jgi:hypothetical protein
MRWKGKTERVYLRTLPGAGYVAIDVTSVRRVFRRGHYRGVVLVERRSDGARHRTFAPVVIARAAGSTIDSVVQQLLPAAECNPAIGAALLRCVPPVVPAKPLGVRQPRIVHIVRA